VVVVGIHLFIVHVFLIQPVVVAMMAVAQANRNTYASGRDCHTLSVLGMTVTWCLKISKNRLTISSEDTTLIVYPTRTAK